MNDNTTDYQKLDELGRLRIRATTSELAIINLVERLVLEDAADDVERATDELLLVKQKLDVMAGALRAVLANPFADAHAAQWHNAHIALESIADVEGGGE